MHVSDILVLREITYQTTKFGANVKLKEHNKGMLPVYSNLCLGHNEKTKIYVSVSSDDYQHNEEVVGGTKHLSTGIIISHLLRVLHR